MRTAALVLALLLSCVTLAQADEDELQGMWVGAGRDAGYTLIFCGESLIGIVGTDPTTQRMISMVRIQADSGELAIARPDGVQLGRYSVHGEQLQLSLSRMEANPSPAWLKDCPSYRPNHPPVHAEAVS